MDVFEQLLTSSSRGSVSPETLEYIGQRASNEFLEKKASLNQSIVKLASQHPELNNDHIRRIAEFANNATFQSMFEKNHDKNVHFDVADPGVIIRDLRDGGSPAHSGKVLHNKQDYFQAPLREEKDAGIETEGTGLGSGLADLFQRENSSGQFGQGEPIAKTASAGLDPNWEGSANPINDVYAQHVKLERAKDILLDQHESADLAHQQASTDFYKAAKLEILSGGSFRSVVEAIQGVGPFSQEEVEKLAETLMRNGVSADALLVGRTKTAGKLVNPEHPLVKAAVAMTLSAMERSMMAEALHNVESGLQKTAAFLKENR